MFSIHGEYNCCIIIKRAYSYVQNGPVPSSSLQSSFFSEIISMKTTNHKLMHYDEILQHNFCFLTILRYIRPVLFFFIKGVKSYNTSNRFCYINGRHLFLNIGFPSTDIYLFRVEEFTFFMGCQYSLNNLIILLF